MGNIIDTIQDQLQTDEEPIEKVHDHIVQCYNSYDDAQKRAVNEIFIALVGYSLDTLLEM
ncbi:MAG: hypothetical protein Q8934_08830 [Bacillota bacterium]|nr:hypothetical protein [Bacillota bacterium]